MLRSFILKRLDLAEKQLGASLDYLRHILNTSFAAFVKFALFMPLAAHRRRLPAEPYHVARLVATKHEDCGTCVQIVVTAARDERVSADIVRAVLAGRAEALAPELADVYHFTRAVLAASGEEGDARERLRARYGEEGLVELALGIASARVFPTTKRALGYATSCALVEVKV
jgi:alkylhydroperoxidase family enzyme